MWWLCVWVMRCAFNGSMYCMLPWELRCVLGWNRSESGIIILYRPSEQGYLILALYKYSLLYVYICCHVLLAFCHWDVLLLITAIPTKQTITCLNFNRNKRLGILFIKFIQTFNQLTSQYHAKKSSTECDHLTLWSRQFLIKTVNQTNSNYLRVSCHVIKH